MEKVIRPAATHGGRFAVLLWKISVAIAVNRFGAVSF